jgi:hypothetical protein
MKSHRADLVSLFFGLVFLTVAGWWAITYFFDVRLNVPNFGWFAAGALILVGVLGIVASLRRERTDEDDTLEPVREPALVSPITEETLTDPTPTWRLDLPEPPRSDPFESPRSEPFESPRSEPPVPPAAQEDDVTDTEDTFRGTATGESPR